MKLIRPDLNDLPPFVHENFFRSIHRFRKELKSISLEHRKEYNSLRISDAVPARIVACLTRLYECSRNPIDLFVLSFDETIFSDPVQTSGPKEGVDYLTGELSLALLELTRVIDEARIIEERDLDGGKDLEPIIDIWRDHVFFAVQVEDATKAFLQILQEIRCSRRYLEEHLPFRISEDFRKVKIEGIECSLTEAQARILQIMLEAFKNGEAPLTGGTIMKRAGLTGKFKDAFRTKQCVKSRIIRTLKGGEYLLNC